MGGISPIRDWRVDIAGKPYGLSQWNKGTSEIYVGKFICHLPVSPPAAASGLVLLAMLLVIGVIRALAPCHSGLPLGQIL